MIPDSERACADHGPFDEKGTCEYRERCDVTKYGALRNLAKMFSDEKSADIHVRVIDTWAGDSSHPASIYVELCFDTGDELMTLDLYAQKEN